MPSLPMWWSIDITVSGWPCPPLQERLLHRYVSGNRISGGELPDGVMAAALHANGQPDLAREIHVAALRRQRIGEALDSVEREIETIVAAERKASH